MDVDPSGTCDFEWSEPTGSGYLCRLGHHHDGHHDDGHGHQHPNLDATDQLIERYRALTAEARDLRLTIEARTRAAAVFAKGDRVKVVTGRRGRYTLGQTGTVEIVWTELDRVSYDVRLDRRDGRPGQRTTLLHPHHLEALDA